MIKAYLIFLMVVYSMGIYAYNQPPAPLTPAQLQKKAKDSQKARICARLKKGAKYDRLCDKDGFKVKS